MGRVATERAVIERARDRKRESVYVHEYECMCIYV